MPQDSGWPDPRLVWIALGVVLAALVGLALYRYVGSVLFAIFLYYATRPVYERIERHLGHPNVTATVTILLVVLPMFAIVCYAGFVALRELDQFLAATDLEPLRSALDPYLAPVRRGDFGELRDALTEDTDGSIGAVLRQGLPTALERLSSAAGFVLGLLAKFFLMITVLFYLLRDDEKLRHWFERSVGRDASIFAFLDAVDDDLEVIFVGNLAVVGVAAVFAAVSYYGLNLIATGSVVDTPVLLALLIGIGTLIPAVGMKIVYVPYGLVMLGFAVATPRPLWHPIAFFAVSATVVDTIPDFFARSFLSARSGIHMGLVLLGYFFGTLAFGWYGLFFGPIVVVLLVHFAHDVFPDLASTILRD
ncbi:AI-2E family transporter [Halovivax limisalsi]|uniref:AI-2E family transporter n=1 Tax=Halovivax limisalsi TaxID=1453760 RepID=UPI001FFD761D|nr:AI-2E family transporter [Halovivax limisalsi]